MIGPMTSPSGRAFRANALECAFMDVDASQLLSDSRDLPLSDNVSFLWCLIRRSTVVETT